MRCQRTSRPVRNQLPFISTELRQIQNPPPAHEQLTQVPAQQRLRQGRVALLQQRQLVGIRQQHLPQQRRVVQALREGGRVGRRWAQALRWWLVLLRGCPGDCDAAEVDPWQTWSGAG